MSKLIVSLILFKALFGLISTQYLPTWESLDTRPLPQWYDDAKIGIFIVWGLYSVPAITNEWFWYFWANNDAETVDFMKKNYPPNFTYADFASEFHAEFFDPDQWAELFQAAGAKYIVLTTKHCEGYTLWPSKQAFSWNSVDVGPKRDLVGDLAKSLRNKTDIKLGLYYALYEWFNPLFPVDQNNNFKTQKFVESKVMPDLYELIMNYKPDILWADADWMGPDFYWNSTQFLAWLYNESPVKDHVVTTDRWGNNGVNCKHGDFWTCTDRYNPNVLVKHKWENCMTIDRYSWGYRRNAKLTDYLTIEELLVEVVTTVSCGGNILIDVGPTKEGLIIPILEERLRQLGQWLSINGEAIYASRPWLYQNDTVNSNVWYTTRDSFVYAILLKWPVDKIVLAAPKVTATTVVSMLGYKKPIVWSKLNDTNGIAIDVNQFQAFSLPTTWAWVFKLENLSNQKF